MCTESHHDPFHATPAVKLSLDSCKRGEMKDANEQMGDDEMENRKKRRVEDMYDSSEKINEIETMGRLIPLKTTLETRGTENLVDVYITRVPVKKASVCLE